MRLTHAGPPPDGGRRRADASTVVGRGTRAASRLAIVLWLLLITGPATQAAPPPCDLECEREEATRLIERGETRAAVRRLRDASSRHPGDRPLKLLLARSYLLEGNLFWGERVLRDMVADGPGDLEARAWLASVHLRQGDPDLAHPLLDAAPGAIAGPDRARWMLLRSLSARLEGDQETARAALHAVPESGELYPEDRSMWKGLRSQVAPLWTEPITGAVELAGGWTSNALAGAPTDPGASGEGSGLGRLELWSRLASVSPGTLGPAVDLEILGVGLRDPSSRELSSLQASARLAGQLSGWERRWLLGYRAEVLYLDQEPSRYAEAHRGELELETAAGAVLLAGAGRRTYRDERRTRWEGDVSFGGPLRLFGRTPTIAGATLRLADAHSPAYDQLGLSLAVAFRVPLGRSWFARVALAGSFDDYPHSGGDEGRLVFGTTQRRRDLLGRTMCGVWAPSWRTLQPGFEVQLARRWSTADETRGFDFSYREVRLMVVLRWSFAGDPWGPRLDRSPDHVPMPWGAGAGAPVDQERILDLLRQDEELRRGSSCGI